jgi:hypothetical protein
MATEKNYHKPPEDPRTIGGGLKAQGRERREKLQMMINSRPHHTQRSAARDVIADTCNRGLERSGSWVRLARAGPARA